MANTQRQHGQELTEDGRPYYYVIDFTGKYRAWYKYMQLRNACTKLVGILRNTPEHDMSVTIKGFMRGTGGFNKAHMPYYVTLTPREARTLLAGFYTHMPKWYHFCRRHGGWAAAGKE